jgi:hypothetical protein
MNPTKLFLTSCLLVSPFFAFSQTSYLVAGDKTSPGIYSSPLSDTCTATDWMGLPDSLEVDVNGDGSADVEIYAYEYFGTTPYFDIWLETRPGSSVSVDGLGDIEPWLWGDTLFTTATWDDNARLKYVPFAGGGSDVGTYGMNKDSLYVGVKLADGALGFIQLRLDTNGLCLVGCAKAIVNEVTAGFTFLSAPEAASVPDFNLFPNPAHAALTLRSPASADWRITDLQGRILLHQEGTQAWTADVSALAPGMYFAQVITGGRTTVKRFLKQ